MSAPAVEIALIAHLTAGHPDRAAELQTLLARIPEQERGEIARKIIQCGPSTDLEALVSFGGNGSQPQAGEALPPFLFESNPGFMPELPEAAYLDPETDSGGLALVLPRVWG